MRSCRVWGMESDHEALARIPSGSYEEVQAVDLNRIDQWRAWPHSFDVIIAADVLEHLMEPERVLRALVDLLAPNGRVIISLPNVANFSTRLMLLAGRFEYTETGILDRTHLHLYTYASARRLVEGVGLQILATYAGSDRFGVLLNRSPLLLRGMGGLLAYNIIIVASERRGIAT